MILRPTRLALAAALVAVSCRAGGGAPPIRPDDAGPGAARLHAVVADDPDTDEDAGRADGGAPDEPAAYLAYVAEAERRCKPTPPEESTWGMVRDTEAYLRCHAEMFTAAVDKLPAEKRAALLDADPAMARDGGPEPVLRFWNRTIDAVCRFQNARLWVHGGTMMAGSMCHNTTRWCFEGPDLGLGFLVQSWLSGRAGEAADHVRAHRGTGRQARRALRAWTRYAPLARGTAPFSADTYGQCEFMTRLGDADWIELEGDLALVESGPPRLAAALCSAWPELAGALGGDADCVAAVTAYDLSTAAVLWSSLEEPAPDQGPDPPSADVPPPGDPDLLAELRPLRDRCAAHRLGECLAGARREEEARAGLPFAARLGRFAGDACRLSGLFSPLSLADNDYHPSLRLAADPRCTPTADLLQVYALRRLGGGGAAAFAAHVRGRSAWGRTVKDGAAEALRIVDAPCKGKDKKGPCNAGTPAERRKAADLLRRLPSDAASVAADVCKTEGLADALGGSGPCAQEVERWLFSFGTSRLDRR